MFDYKILPPTYIVSPLTCFSKKRLFEEISNVAASVSKLKASHILQALNERESYGATICASGVGIPHALIPELTESIALLAILQKEIPYHTVDSDYVGADVIFAFFISPKESYEKVEEMLRLLSKELQNPDVSNSFRRTWQDNNKLELFLKKLDGLLDLAINPPPTPSLNIEEQENNTNQEIHI